jgi:hypothetical protein
MLSGCLTRDRKELLRVLAGDELALAGRTLLNVAAGVMVVTHRHPESPHGKRSSDLP